MDATMDWGIYSVVFKKINNYNKNKENNLGILIYLIGNK